MSETAKIQVRGLKKAFGRNEVLRGVDLDVPAGSSVVVIGGSGTGKSVLLKCILGLLRADAGSVTVDGTEIVGASGRALEQVRRKFGMLFQGGALFDSLPVWENVSFGVRAREKIGADAAKRIAIANLEQVGLSADVADLMPAELSGGMQKRVSLARAVALKPEIIFFDEPTTGLDPIMADVINDLIRKITQAMGVTALSITHDMASVRKIADYVAMLYQGSVIWYGPVAELERSGSEFVDQFIHGRADGPIVVGQR